MDTIEWNPNLQTLKLQNSVEAQMPLWPYCEIACCFASKNPLIYRSFTCPQRLLQTWSWGSEVWQVYTLAPLKFPVSIYRLRWKTNWPWCIHTLLWWEKSYVVHIMLFLSYFDTAWVCLCMVQYRVAMFHLLCLPVSLYRNVKHDRSVSFWFKNFPHGL